MKQILALFVGIIVGVGVAFLIGWVLFPVGPYDSTPDVLRADYHAEYVRMVAIVYQVDGNLETAQARLRQLSPNAPLTTLITQTERGIAQGKAERLLIPLIRLARNLGVETPAMRDYLARGTP